MEEMPPEVVKVLRDQKDTISGVMKFQMFKEQKTWEYWQVLIYQIILTLMTLTYLRLGWAELTIGSFLLGGVLIVFSLIFLLILIKTINMATKMRKELCPTKS